ncbi:MAG: YqfO family protein, partial [Syntrophothermus sp.]
MKVKDITGYLEDLYPPILQEDYDNCGLITGNLDQDVTGVLLCLDITRGVMDEARENGCNMIVSHHPMVFRGLKKINGSDPVQQLVIRSVRENLAIFAVHTSIDNALEGLNKYMGEKFGLQNIRILQPRSKFLQKLVTYVPENKASEIRQALFAAGAGHIGNYDQCSYNLAGEGTFRANELANPYVGEKNELHFEKETRIEVVMPGYLRNKIINALVDIHPYEEVAYDVYSLENEFSAAGSGIIGDLE